MTTLIILISVMIGLSLSPIFIIYSLTKKINWKMIFHMYKDWFKS